jgi:pimeloyl-ACP methyl ester carboxylesterase
VPDEAFEPRSGGLSQLVVDDTKVGRLTFDVWIAGPTEGETVVLLHGFPETYQQWGPQIDALSAAGYRVIAPNQRGYSPGARPADVESYRFSALIGDVFGIVDAVGAIDTFHLVGHDWGGAVAWQLAGRRPERLRSLAVLSTPHPRAFADALAPTGDAPAEQATRSSYIEMFRMEGTEVGMLANDMAGLRLIFAGGGMSDEQAKPYLEALGTPEALGAALNWYRAADLTDSEGLQPITVPVLYIWGIEDVALGRDAAEATANHVDGPYEFVELTGVNHWLCEQAPDAVNDALLAHLARATATA